MVKFFLRFFVVVLIVAISTIIFLSFFGIETDKLDGLIKSKANEVNRYVKLEFKKTKIVVRHQKKKIKYNSKSLILKLVRLQNKLQPKFKFRINFGLEKVVQGFFQKIADKVYEYKFIKAEEKRRLNEEVVRRIRDEQIFLKEKEKSLEEESERILEEEENRRFK